MVHPLRIESPYHTCSAGCHRSCTNVSRPCSTKDISQVCLVADFSSEKGLDDTAPSEIDDEQVPTSAHVPGKPWLRRNAPITLLYPTVPSIPGFIWSRLWDGNLLRWFFRLKPGPFFFCFIRLSCPLQTFNGSCEMSCPWTKRSAKRWDSEHNVRIGACCVEKARQCSTDPGVVCLFQTRGRLQRQLSCFVDLLTTTCAKKCIREVRLPGTSLFACIALAWGLWQNLPCKPTKPPCPGWQFPEWRHHSYTNTLPLDQKRAAINGDDVLWAVNASGFQAFDSPLRNLLYGYR